MNLEKIFIDLLRYVKTWINDNQGYPTLVDPVIL